MRTLLTILVFATLAGSVRAGGPFKASLSSDMMEVGSFQELTAIDTVRGENTRLVSAGLAVLLGPFGAHRLYLGTTPKVAIIYGVTFGGFGILAVIDLAHILFSKDLEAYRNNDRVFMWSKSGKVVTPQ